jgi:Domain of unknown function (DUF5666)
MQFPTFRTLAAGALALIVSACGGGGGDGGIGGTGGGGGAGGSDVSVGTITAFGSVWVNGVKFDSGTATIRIDDNPHPESDLRIGMVARVDGSISGASASTITVSSAAKGTVESVTGNQMVVMGQTVITDGATTINNGPIAAGDYVEVHGLVASDGTISATYIEKKAAVASYAVKGFVKAHNTTTNAFDIGNLHVVMGPAPVLNDMPPGSWNGLQVEVKGTACAGSPPAACGTLTASKVEPHGPRGQVANTEVEGFITAFASASSFSVGGQAVVTTGTTQYEGGVAGDLVQGTKVEVEGSLSGGVITATKVSFRESIRFEANIATKVGNALTLAGLSGITVETNALTRFKNQTFANLSVGNNLRIRARPGSNGTVIATEVEQKSTSPDNRVIMQAVASAVVAPPTETVTLLGIVINTSQISNNSFKDVNDAVIGRAAFYQQAAPGRLIKVRGSLAASTITWDQEIQLED